MGPEGFGALNMAMGIGSTIGAVLMATRVGSTLRVVFLSAAAYSVLVLAVSGVPNLLVAFPLLIVTGIASVAYSASSNTLVQTEARPEYRGRVLSLYTLLLAGSTPLGGGLTGLAADHWSVRLALVVNGLFCIAGTTAAWFYLRVTRGRTTQSDQPPLAACAAEPRRRT
jgi:MFS family permease